MNVIATSEACMLHSVENCLDTIETMENYKFSFKTIALDVVTYGDALIFDSLITDFLDL